jgi:outer membrane protein assembly factor BamD (BamD/ComL family)
MKFSIPVMTSLVLTASLAGTLLAADNITPQTASQDSVNLSLDKANQSLKEQNYDQAISELINIIKQQQNTINELKKNRDNIPPSAPGLNATQAEKENFLKQLSKSLPFMNNGMEDVEGQWKKAYELQHKAIFDLSRKAAIPVFEEAIKEYRVLVEYYPHSKRAPQAQRQIAWIYQTQLKDEAKARIEWKKLIEFFPNSTYASEARSFVSEN